MAPVLVQAKTNNGATASLVVGATQAWATPTAGNLLVAWGNSDGTITTPSGFTAGPSVVDGNGAYSFYKVSAGTESTITFGNGANNTTVGVLEYSGIVGASPLDASNSANTTGVGSTSTPSVSVTTVTANDLVIAMALIHSGTVATGPSWTNSFVNQQSATQGTGTTSVSSFVADRVVTTAAAYATVASWTNTASDRQALILAFKPSTGGVTTLPELVMTPRR